MNKMLMKPFIGILRLWFTFTFYTCVLPAALLTKLAHMLPFLTLRQREMLSAQIAGIGFRAIFVLNPQMKIEYVGHGDPDWDALFADPSQRPLVLVNHTSMLDAFFYSACIPTKHIKHLRTLAKSTLFQVPLFGSLLKACGHYPVYFNDSSKLNDFSVDKAAQEKVQKQIEEHVDAGGGLSLFPEGQINRKDTKTLQAFRRGSLSLAKRKNMSLWGFLAVGLDDFWPTNQTLGGYPATVRFKLFRIPTKPDDEDIVEYVSHIEKIMQLELDLVHAINDHSEADGIAKKRAELIDEIHLAAHGSAQVEQDLRKAVDMETRKTE